MSSNTPDPKQTPVVGMNGATLTLLISGAALIVIGAVVGFANANAAAASERAGAYEATLVGGFNSFVEVAASQHLWMWIGFSAAILGILMLMGVLFLRAARRQTWLAEQGRCVMATGHELRVIPRPVRRGIGMIRVSKERDGMTSPEVQRHAIEQYATRQNIEIAEWVEVLSTAKSLDDVNTISLGNDGSAVVAQKVRAQLGLPASTTY